MAHDVFISYATSDRAVANAVCSQLESIHRVRCWIAPRDITPGASWAESIIDALDTAKIMVLIFSSSANASMQIEREVERAVHKGIHIIPLRIEDATPTKTLEYFISAPHWLDALSTPMEEHIDKLAISVKALLAKGAHGRPAITETHELPEAAASAPPAAAPRTAAASAAPAAKRESSWAFPALVGAAIAGLVAVIAYQFMVPRATPSSAPQTTAAPATTSVPATAPQPQAPAAEPSASAAAQPASPAPSAGAPPGSTTAASRAAGAAAPTTAAAAVDPKSAAATGKPNLFIDFRNPIDEGSIAVSIDGQQRWSASLAPPPPDASGKRGRAPEVLTRALSVPPGDHKVEIQLLHADGRSRERRDLSMRLEPAQPRTMRIRLSRFKRDLQVAMVAGALPTDPTDAADAKAAQAKESQAKAAPAKTAATTAAAKPPATAKPAATAAAPAAKAQVAKEK